MEKTLNLIFGTVLFLGVLGYLPGIPELRIGKEMMLSLCIIVTLSVFFVENRWVTCFLLWGVASVFYFFYSGDVNGTHYMVAKWVGGVTSALRNFTFFIVFYESLKRKVSLKLCMNVICVIALFHTLLVLVQSQGVWFSILPLAKGHPIKWEIWPKTFYSIIVIKPFAVTPVGFLSNPNMASSLLALCFPMFLRKKWCWFIPLLILAVFFCKSMGGIIPVSIVSVLWVSFKDKGFGAALGVLLIGFLSLYVTYFNDVGHLLTGSGRFDVWKVCIKDFIKLKPIIGYGLGSGHSFYKEIMIRANTTIAFLHPHNEYINVALEAGLVGLGLMLGFLIGVFRKGFRMARENKLMALVLLGFIVGVINCGVNFLLHTTAGIVFVVYIALIESQYKKETAHARG